MNALGQISKKYIDATNDGTVDKVEVYTRNANGHVTAKDSYLGQTAEGTPDAKETYTIDSATGLTLSKLVYDGKVLSSVNYKYNIYGHAIETIEDKNNDGTPDQINYARYDEHGNKVYMWNDILADGVKGPAEEEVYSTFENGLKVYQKSIQADSGAIKYEGWYEYNDSLQVKTASFSYDGKTDKSTVTRIENYEYNDLGQVSRFTRGPKNTPTEVTEYTYDSAGRLIYTQTDWWKANGTFDDINFARSNVDSKTDFTSWDQLSLSHYKLQRITLSNETARTEITLDKATVAKMFVASTQIRGDATDTVHLKDYTEADKLDATVTSGGQTYNQYVSTTEGVTHTVLIDTDINVTFG